MVTVEKVRSAAQRRAFIDFPDRLYRGNPCYVPELHSDERQLFSKNYHYYETCEAEFFLATRSGNVVGRIAAILQKAANEKYGQKRVRFNRFDSIDDQEVADALFKAVEDWARGKGMEEVVGPLGFSDLEREGLLIEGFDQPSTFEEQYNAAYYQKLIENLGYTKEVDWLESQLYLPEDYDGSLEVLGERLMKRYKLHFGEAPNIRKWIHLYADDWFDLLDKSYENIYGTVPFTEGMKKSLLKSFKLLIRIDQVHVILNEENQPVCMGLCFPSIAEAVRKCGGRLTPSGIIGLLKAARHPKVMDLCLIGVDPKYANTGAPAVFLGRMVKLLRDSNIEYCETNLNLEDNDAIRHLWNRFREVQNKRRRAFVKRISN